VTAIAQSTMLRARQPIFDMQTDFFDRLSDNDIPGAGAILADNCLFLFPGLKPVHGAALTTRMLRIIRRRFADIRWTRTFSVNAEPDWMISAWTVKGTFAQGGEYNNEVVSVVRLDVNGKVAYLSDYFKSTDFSPPPAHHGAQASVALAL
jgi:ketosteroid isomerase-like protein